MEKIGGIMYYMILTPLMVIMFIAIMFGISRMKKMGFNYSKRVLIALGIGIILGLFIHFASGTDLTQGTDNLSKIDAFINEQVVEQGLTNYESTIQANMDTLEQVVISKGVVTEATATGIIVQLMEIVSGLYITLLKLLVVPLILVSIVTALLEGRKRANMGSKIGKVLAVLMITVSISAIIGIIVAIGADLATGAFSTADTSVLATVDTTNYTDKAATLSEMSFSDFILAPVPDSFGFLVGSGSSYALSTVLFGMFLGYAIIQVDKRKPEKVKPFIDFIYSLKEVVLSMILETLKLTPYAVVTLMASMIATTSLSSLGDLLVFVIATYVAIFIMYIIQLLFVASVGLNPIAFVKKTWEVIVFGFTSRSSMASLPLNIRTQTDKLGVDESSANISGSFGVTIGQNGCAGIYPAMIVVMTWLAMGHDITILNIILLIIVIMISSFGIAGVGGGASFAAVAVLSIMGLPIGVAAVLIAVEPLLDMARTALNISGSIVAGVVTSKLDHELDIDKYNE